MGGTRLNAPGARRAGICPALSFQKATDVARNQDGQEVKEALCAQEPSYQTS